jgi:hypothetical protein
LNDRDELTLPNPLGIDVEDPSCRRGIGLKGRSKGRALVAQGVRKAHGGEAERKPEGLPEVIAWDDVGVELLSAPRNGLREEGRGDRGQDEVAQPPG